VEGRVVGWLGVREHERPAHPLDVEFLRLQARTFSSIGGVALLLAVVVTWVLSRHLLAPVKELAEGTRALTSRRFETRIEVRSGDELGLLAADFNNMAQALERYEQLRRQWIADISHELRTPLAILRGEIEAMLDGVREVRRESLESLHFEVLHVSRIVQDLHDLSIIESETFHATMTAICPLDVLDETLRTFQTRLEQLGIKIEVGKPDAEKVSILGDGDRLKQLFSNLLENTLRYTNGPGVLWVSHEVTPDGIHLHFEDSGPGVPEESLDRLFDRLYRVDKARRRAQGGSGLGLAICKSIVESFGGRIEASNGTSGGLRVSIQFPRISHGVAVLRQNRAETKHRAPPNT
jgi:two-component system sensor histidine kinase BaeS